MSAGQHLILYDGVCGLCNGSVRFILPRDGKDRFRFAALQSEQARARLARFGRSADGLDTFYVIADFESDAPRVLDRDAAALFVLQRLNFPWCLAAALKIVPRFLRRPVYNFFAQRRYAWFGKYDACPLPAPESRHKFLK
jgi:predicted DCC family thiol-disulfide oxidoreductase YuxK